MEFCNAHSRWSIICMQFTLTLIVEQLSKKQQYVMCAM